MDECEDCEKGEGDAAEELEAGEVRVPATVDTLLAQTPAGAAFVKVDEHGERHERHGDGGSDEDTDDHSERVHGHQDTVGRGLPLRLGGRTSRLLR